MIELAEVAVGIVVIIALAMFGRRFMQRRRRRTDDGEIYPLW